MPNFKPTVDHIRIIPLGGLDQFGMNCCVIEFDNTLVMVDCGLAFPDDRTPGVDYILPDWHWLLQNNNLRRLSAIFITHGHEDHLGGLPFLLEDIDEAAKHIPIFTGSMTAQMLRNKLAERNFAHNLDIVISSPGDIFELDGFSVEFIHVNHSIPNAMSLAFHTALGYLIFTGDWKMDQSPLYEPVIDLHRFAEIGGEGVIALLGDSTNAMTSTPLSRSEHVVKQNLREIINHSDGRVIVAQFSSNIHRVRALLDIARQTNRQLALLGLSLERNFEIATNLGFIPPYDHDILVPFNEIEEANPDQLIVVMTGSQAEPRASLPRYAFNNHKFIKASQRDTVILSSRIIPGNEADIFKMLNQLARQNIRVITPIEKPIHASGHARPEELKLLISLTKPKFLVPMHGDYRIRKMHQELARTLGVDSILIDDGTPAVLSRDGYWLDDPVPHGKVAIDGKTILEVGDTQLRDRVKISSSGIVVAYMLISSNDGTIISGPDLFQRGFLSETNDVEHILNEASNSALKELETLTSDARLDRLGIGETLRIHVRRYFQKTIARKPIVIPIINFI